MQLAWAGTGSAARAVTVPEAGEEVVPGVRWGALDVPNTPAYWAVRCQWEEANPDYVSKDATLAEEAGFCLLGGYGIRYEVNEAAFERLRDLGVFELDVEFAEEDIRRLLSEPLLVDGRSVRYRFPNQRARRIAAMRAKLRSIEFDGDDHLRMRNSLQEIDGVGPKTASWIVRNLNGSDEVAIIDVHIMRACTLMGVFPRRTSLPRDYVPLERRFIAFSRAIDVRPSVLDAVIWSEMRSVPARNWNQGRVDS